MGDRVLTVFHDGEEFSPVVYQHWGGDTNPKRLVQLRQLMASRGVDLPYATARFIGLLHVATPGNLSLGVWNAPACATFDDTLAALTAEDYSHGNAGVCIVDLRTWHATMYHGYGPSGEICPGWELDQLEQ